jgi:hypothetical protein
MNCKRVVALHYSAAGVLFSILTSPALAIEPVASGAKIYINSMDGFGSYITAAFRVKGVPLVVVANKSVADYEVIGTSDSQKAGWAKVIFLKQTGSREEASISVVDLRTSEVVFAYNYNTANSYRGKQSAAESCAKHLAEAILKGGRFASSLPPLTEQQIAASKVRDPVSDPAPTQVAKAQPPPNVEEPKGIVVQFTSTPNDAEVNIDGEYWGSTPTVELTRLLPGAHTIAVKKLGYKIWERKITLVPGDVRTIGAELEPEAIDPSKPRIVGNQFR